MKEFKIGKVIRRQVTIRSSDRALPNTAWILTLDGGGVRIRRLQERKENEMFLSWRSVISHALIHKQARKPTSV